MPPMQSQSDTARHDLPLLSDSRPARPMATPQSMGYWGVGHCHSDGITGLARALFGHMMKEECTNGRP
ncbi:hypothetical protein J7I01_004632 [Vibrio parahaemolyticus]|nr:hypothetical protein [Vibrio parahaemolyticus]